MPTPSIDGCELIATEQHLSQAATCVDNMCHALTQDKGHTLEGMHMHICPEAEAVCQSLCWTSNVKVPLNEAPICSSRTAHHVCFVSTQTERTGNVPPHQDCSCCRSSNMDNVLSKSCFIYSIGQHERSTLSLLERGAAVCSDQVIIMEQMDWALNCLIKFSPSELWFTAEILLYLYFLTFTKKTTEQRRT